MTMLDLPIPPSVNALWRSNRRVVHVSKRYTDWRRTAGWELVRQKPARVAGPVSITIAVGRPDKRKRDLDNIAGKALLDLLVACRVLDDDAQVTSLVARWDSIVPPGRILVTVQPAASERDLVGSIAARGLDL